MPHAVRTCVGCRARADKRELLRIVWRPGGPVADPRQTEPGRGAYLHADERCLGLAIKRKALGRALRVQGQSVDPEVIRAAFVPRLAPAPQPTSRNRGPVA